LFDGEHIEVFFYDTDTTRISSSITTDATFISSFISDSSAGVAYAGIFFDICDIFTKVFEVIFVCRQQKER